MHCTFVRDGKTCGAPTYQNPCASCISYQRTLAERGTVPLTTGSGISQPSSFAVSAMEFPKYRALHALLHHLWTKNVGGHLYDKKEWEELEAGIDDLACTGLGPHQPAPIAQQYGEDLTASLGPAIPIISMATGAPPMPSPLPENLMAPIKRPVGG